MSGLLRNCHQTISLPQHSSRWLLLAAAILLATFAANFAPAAILALSDEGTTVVLRTSALEVRVTKTPWQLEVRDAQSAAVLLREAAGQALQFGTHRVTNVTSFTLLGETTIVKRDPPFIGAEDEAVITGETVRFHCGTDDSTRTMEVRITFRNPHVFSVWATVENTIVDTKEVFESAADEHFFGLGECWDAQSLDLKGLSLTMNNGNGTPDQGGYVPFYLSTRGYGVLVDNYLRVNFAFQPATTTLTIPAIAGSSDGAGYFAGAATLWYFYYGPDPLDVIERYTEHVSRPAQPPSWALFAPWQWRDNNDQDGVYADIAGMRAQQIPCGLIWVDRPWAQGDQNMPPPFEWYAPLFPNGSQMFADAQAQGFKCGVWVAKNLYGDFVDPALNAQLQSDVQPWIVRDNAQMYKIDRGNEQRMDPYFTCQAYFNTWNEILGGDFITLPRVVAFRGQKHVSGKWPGDNDNTFAYPSGLQANIAAMLNFAISGFPFWGSDTGGFPDPPGNTVTLRWAQFSALCPIFETAGRPYAYAAANRDIFRKYAELYTQLFPYRWTYARRAHETGQPICRALALQYPQDVNGYNQKQEYLFGEWILVAPLAAGGTSRDIYLPPGEWIDWWDGTHYTGGVTLPAYPAPLDKLPLFIRAGAIIPLIDVQQTWLGSTCDPLTLRVYPSGTSEFAMAGNELTYPLHPSPYTDLRATTFTCVSAPEQVEISCSPTTSALRLEVHPDFTPAYVRVNGRNLATVADAAAFAAAAEGWYHDAATGGVTRVKVPGTVPAEARIIVLEVTQASAGFSRFVIY